MSGYKAKDLQLLELIVAEEGRISEKQLLSKTRRVESVEARAVLWHIAKAKLGYRYAQLGRLYDYDHTTILSAVRKVATAPRLLEMAAQVSMRYKNLQPRVAVEKVGKN